MESEASASVFPNDVWSVILKHLHLFDAIFIRATNSTLYKVCKEFRPFPKYFVLHQHKCMAYLVENGFISLLDYVKNTLRFEWTPTLSIIAARSGQVEVLKHLVNHGFAINNARFMFECTNHSCELSMIKYLHENGVPWDQYTSINETQPMENMAYHGHVSCMKYALEHGCTQHVINYTPSIECLDFARQNGFEWTGEDSQSGGSQATYIVLGAKRNICEEAARLGDLTMLKYAHQHGAALKNSAPIANQAGHLECLMYANERSPVDAHPSLSKTLDCFKYLVQKLGLEELRGTRDIWFHQLQNGNLETLRFMLQNGFPFQLSNSILMKGALEASLCSIDTFKFMLNEVKASYESINPYIASITHGNLECLKLCFERNLPNKSPAELQDNNGFLSFMPVAPEPLSQTLIATAIRSKIEILKLLWEKLRDDKGVNMEQCLNEAVYSTPEILEFFTQQGAQWTSQHLSMTSLASNLPNMAYLTRAGCKWNAALCRSATALIAKYAREHGCTHFE